MSDDALKPLWPSELETMFQDTVALSALAEKADIPIEIAHIILEGLVEAEKMDRVFVPICPVTEIRIREYTEEDEFPDPISCSLCGGAHYVEDIKVAVQYIATRGAFDPVDQD